MQDDGYNYLLRDLRVSIGTVCENEKIFLIIRVLILSSAVEIYTSNHGENHIKNTQKSSKSLIFRLDLYYLVHSWNINNLVRMGCFSAVYPSFWEGIF